MKLPTVLPLPPLAEWGDALGAAGVEFEGVGWCAMAWLVVVVAVLVLEVVGLVLGAAFTAAA
jgi:hypothetical protein